MAALCSFPQGLENDFDRSESDVPTFPGIATSCKGGRALGATRENGVLVHGRDRRGEREEARFLHHGKAVHAHHCFHGDTFVQRNHLCCHQVAFMPLEI